jgi:HAD superfamily hydrolase (TIGR01662 family)
MAEAPRDIRCILFDLGSTLWDAGDPAVMRREDAAAEARTGGTLRALLAPESVAWDDGARGRELRSRFFTALHAAYVAEPLLEPDYAALTHEILLSLGIAKADTHWGATIYEAMRVRSVHARALFPDVLSTLETLRQRGYALGVVTNRAYGGHVFLDDLRQMELLRFFDPRSIAVSADLGYRKPHPAIFLYALAGLECVPHQTAMVGDKLAADILGASRLGMLSVWRPYATKTEPPLDIVPDAVIGQTADLLALFLGPQ